MRRFSLLLALLCATTTLSAQYYQDARNVDMLHWRQPRNIQRVEFYAPTIDGYTPYKADLHTHTIFSDGHLSMEARVREAWADGLDVMAVTEHLEYRPHEKNLVKYMEGYAGKGVEAQAYSFVEKNEPKVGDIKVDLNAPVEFARKAAEMYNMTIVSGIEITRKPDEYCHFNALFTTDNNAIYHPDPKISLQRAKEQGALVMHNHPGWRRLDMQMTPFEVEVYEAGLIDGVEVANGTEFYPKAISRALKYNLFMSANTDIHYPSAESYSTSGARRNMTIIYAKDKSVESLREAIEAHRTLSYAYGTLVGSEEMLRKFFEGAITVNKNFVDAKGRIQMLITNNSSVDWLLYREGDHRHLELKANSSIIVRINPAKPKPFTVLNTWYDEDKHLVYEIK